jgi:PIN domain nuclease of toxin-antitoxin system
MRLLLDTHALLWFLGGDPKLSRLATDLMLDPDNEILVSVASLWEIAIKAQIGKLALHHPFQEIFPAQLTANEIGVLPVDLVHVQQLFKLSLHHRDPFDRLLIAQALAEGVPIISSDAMFDPYPVEVLW